MRDLTIDELAGALGVSRRTIERELDAGRLLPSSRTNSGRARFNAELVARLTLRAKDARRLGLNYVMAAVLANGPVQRQKRRRIEPPVSAVVWVRRMLWKTQNCPRQRRSTNQEAPHARQN